MSTPQLVGAVQCSCELARLQEFIIAQAQSSLSCAQGPQSLTVGGGGLAAAPCVCHLCVCTCVGICVELYADNCVHVFISRQPSLMLEPESCSSSVVPVHRYVYTYTYSTWSYTMYIIVVLWRSGHFHDTYMRKGCFVQCVRA